MAAAIDLEELMALAQEDECIGVCLACGEYQDGVEPDAEDYRCEACGRHRVFGAEQAALMLS